MDSRLDGIKRLHKINGAGLQFGVLRKQALLCSYELQQ